MSSMEKRIIGIVMLSVGMAGMIISFIIMISDVTGMTGSYVGIFARLALYQHTSKGIFMIIITHVFIILAAVGFYVEEINRPNIKVK